MGYKNSEITVIAGISEIKDQTRHFLQIHLIQIVKLLTEHHLEFLNLKGGCRGSSESTHDKMPHCWKSHALVHVIIALTAWTTSN